MALAVGRGLGHFVESAVTYLHFHAVFLLPVLGVLAFIRWQGAPCRLPRPALGTAVLGGLAILYTSPWDNYLVARGVWTYDENRILAAWRVGYVPIEEYAFFVLQTIFTALIFFHFASRDPDAVAQVLGASSRSLRPRWIGALLMLLLAGSGWLAIWREGTGLYFGLITVWAAPVLALQWGIGGDCLWAGRRLGVRAVTFATVYLWVVDAIAIHWDIWAISRAYSTGLTVLGLPIEEALFFLLTNLLVVQGLMLFAHYSAVGWRTNSQSVIARQGCPGAGQRTSAATNARSTGAYDTHPPQIGPPQRK